MNYQDLLNNYEIHPAFKGFESPLELHPKKNKKFEEVYLKILAINRATKNSKVKQLRSEGIKSLIEIFNDLEGQADGDIKLVCFLLELKENCIRLLVDIIECLSFRIPKSPSKKFMHGNQNFFFGKLSSSATDQIMKIANPKIAEFRKNLDQDLFTRESLSLSSGSEISAIHNILENEFKQNGVGTRLAEYMSGDISVLGVSLELSSSKATWWHDAMNTEGRAPKTLYAHFDEFIGYPKAIVYLSDVHESNGPTSVYPGVYEDLNIPILADLIGRVIGGVGNDPNSKLFMTYKKKYHQSMTSPVFREHFMRLPKLLRFNSHFGWDILPKSNIESHLELREKKFLGNVGDYIVFDGAKILHRGGMVRDGERLALQVVFAVSSPPRKILFRIFNRLIKKFKMKDV